MGQVLRLRPEQSLDIGGGYTVTRRTSEILWLRKPNGCELPVPLDWLEELKAAIEAGRATVDDVKKGKFFEKCPDSRMEKFIINGYKNVFARLLNGD
jgi:5-methylcytosine-specific restriction protein B